MSLHLKDLCHGRLLHEPLRTGSLLFCCCIGLNACKGQLICSVLQRMLRRNPLAALSLNRPSSAAPPSPPPDLKHIALEPGDETADDEASQLIATRPGQVLGPYSILKEDHFPGKPTPSVLTLTAGLLARQVEELSSLETNY